MTKLILATSSVYRKEAFGFLGLSFVSQSSDVDEYFDARPKLPKELVSQLAKLKAKAVVKRFKSGIVIGFDSVGYFDGQILEKPKSINEAFERLKRLSGNKLQFYTGVYIINIESKKIVEKVVFTKVWIRDLSDSEINRYLDQDPKFNTYALGFDPLGHYSSSFVNKISGSYNNLTRGIPLETIVKMLPKVGYKL